MCRPVNRAAGQQESYATKCTHQHATLSGQSTWLASEFSFHQTHFVFSSQILYFLSFFVLLCNWRHISFCFQVGWLGRMCDPLHWEVATFAMLYCNIDLWHQPRCIRVYSDLWAFGLHAFIYTQFSFLGAYPIPAQRPRIQAGRSFSLKWKD